MMKRDSLYTRLTITAIVFIVGTSIVIVLAGLHFTTGFIKQRYHEKFRVLAGYLAKNSELGVMIKDTSMLEKLVRNMAELNDIKSVCIKNAAGESLARVDKADLEGSFVKVTEPVVQMTPSGEDMQAYGFMGGESIGYVEIVYSESALSRLRNRLAEKFFWAACALSLISVVWYGFVARSVIAPLKELVSVAGKVSSGDFDVKARPGRMTETKALSVAFNDMLDSIKQHEKDLEKVHIEMAEQKTMAEMGKFSMMVAHEMKNPISIIKGSLDILKKETSRPELKKEMVVYIEDEVKRMNRLVSDFLMYSRPKDPDFTEVEVNRFVEKISSVMMGSAMNNDVVELSKSDEEFYIQVDRSMMERVIRNIIQNACEHAGQDACIDVSISGNEKEVKIILADNGDGIRDDVMEKIFKPFFTTKAKGTGLGLAMARDIVKLHNGSIKAENIDGKGAVFTINLPVKKDSAGA